MKSDSSASGFRKAIGQASVVRIASAAILMATTVVMARTMGPEDLGSYAFAISIISFVTLIVQLGFPEMTVREVAQQVELRRNRLLARYLRHAYTTMISLSILAVSALALLPTFFGPIFEVRWEVILAGLPLILILPMMAQARGILHGTGRSVQSILGQQLYRPGMFLLFLTLALVLGLTLSPITAMALQGLASLFAMLIMKYRAYLAIPKLGRPIIVPARRLASWSLSAFMFTGVAAVQLINTKFDTIALGVLLGDTEVGLYAVCVQLSQAAGAMLMITAVVATPGISRASASGDDHLAERICRQSAQLSLAAALVALAGTFFVGEWFITIIFGPEYTQIWLALMILLAGQTLAALFGPVANLLNMRNQERSTLTLTGLASLINIALNLLLIPHYGLVGAAFATSFAMVTWNILMWGRAWSLWRINASAIPHSVQTPISLTADKTNATIFDPRSE
ncbi:oligosaccharide flippase family protein [Erythrobacter sp. W53]|uniref:oligosaccharide flippase family protein n=1 Tax=Erythrobacter sp. W53 TaxID=3425947 RepID=UPI003D76A3CD